MLTFLYLVGDFADTTKGFIGQTLHLLLRWFLGLPLQLFISPFLWNLIDLFPLVSEDGQTEMTTKVHDGVVACWDRYHVPGLKDLPEKRAM